MDGRHGSKDVVLTGWTAAIGSVCCSKRCEAKWTYWVVRTAAEAVVQAEHPLNLARQIGKMATRIDRQFLAMSDPLIDWLGQYNTVQSLQLTASITDNS